MPKKVTLKEIIESVLDHSLYNNDSNNHDLDRLTVIHNKRMAGMEANTKNLYRQFEKLIKMLGSDKDALKIGGRYEFDESEAPAIFVLMSQLHTGKGIIAEFVEAHKYNTHFSSNDVIEFIHALRDEASKKDTMDQNELAWLAQFFEDIFLDSPLYLLETCHAIIDAFAEELRDLPYNEQSEFLKKVEKILRKKCAFPNQSKKL